MVMVNTPQERIAEIRQQLSSADTAEAERKQLITNRDKLHDELKKLQADLADRELEAHKGKIATPADTNTATVTTLRDALRLLDHKIDRLDAIVDADREALTKELTDAMLALHPDRRKKHEALQATIRELSDWQAIIAAVLESASELDDELQMAVNFRGERYRRGVLGFIFGRSPRAVISHHLGVVAKHAEHLVENLTPVPASDWQPPSSEKNPTAEGTDLLNQLKSCCEELLKRRDDRWSFKQFDTEYPDLSKQVSALRNALEDHHKMVKTSRTAAQEGLKELVAND